MSTDNQRILRGRNNVPSLDTLAQGGMLSEAQADRFVELIIGDDAAHAAAKECLYWYQRPFSRWIVRYPGVLSTKFRFGRSKRLALRAQK